VPQGSNRASGSGVERHPGHSLRASAVEAMSERTVLSQALSRKSAGLASPLDLSAGQFDFCNRVFGQRDFKGLSARGKHISTEDCIRGDCVRIVRTL
jgi:hypothetical protein